MKLDTAGRFLSVLSCFSTMAKKQRKNMKTGKIQMYKKQIGGGWKSELTQLILPGFPLTIAGRDEPNNQS